MTYKYKVWDNELKEWFIPIYPNQKGLKLTRELLFSQSGEIYLRDSDDELTHDSTERFKACAYTGLKDKFEKKVYFDDVLRFSNNSIGVVVSMEDKLGIKLGDPHSYPNDIKPLTKEQILECENIGNINETPDYYIVNQINNL